MHTVLIGLTPSFSGRLAAAAAAAGLPPACCCPAGRETAAAAPDGLKVFSSRAELFSSVKGPGLAVVSGPAESRFAAALEALERGFHALCEPPFCFSVSDFERLRDAAAGRGLALGALQPRDRCQAWRELDSLVTSGRLGRVSWAQAEIFSSAAAPDGGVLAAEGWNAFSGLLALTRLPPLAISARLSPSPGKGEAPADLSAVAAVQFGGADGVVRVAAGAHASGERYAVAGDKGRAELSGRALTVELAGSGSATALFASGPAAASLDQGCLSAELLDFGKEAAGEMAAGSSLRNSRYCAKLLKNAYYSASLRSAAVPL